jgi:type II secretory pathway component GspD/PulD (secretin)
MNSKKTQNITKISSFYIITAYIFLCSAAFAQTESTTKNYNEPVSISEGQQLSEIKDANQIVEKFFYFPNKSPEEISKYIKPMLSNNGYLSIEENAGTILVIDKVSVLLEIEKLIKNLDFPDIDPNEPMVAVNFSSLDINEIIQTLSQWTGKKVVPSKEAMNISITIYSPEKMRRDKAINLLNAALRQHGFVTEEIDDVIYIKPAPPPEGSQVQLLGPDEPLGTIKDKDTIVRKIFKLKNYNPAALGPLILPFLDSHGYIYADESNGTLMVMDSLETLMIVEKIIKQFDYKAYFNNIFPLKHISPDNAAEVIYKIIKLGIIHPTEDIVIIPEPGTNWMNARCSTENIKLIKFLLEILDKPKVTADIAQYNFTANVGLGNATSEQLAELLGFVFKNNSYMKITAVDSQSVIIKYAHKSDIEKIQKIIKMLSVPENNSVTNSSSEPEYDNISVMYVDVNETALILNKIIAEIYPGKITIQPLTSSRQLLVFGKIPYREIVRKLVEEIEFPLNKLQRKTFQLKFADPEKIKSLIDILFMDRNSSSMDN